MQGISEPLYDGVSKEDTQKARTIEYKTILVLQDAQKAALQKRPDKGLLAGMYEFPWMRRNTE